MRPAPPITDAARTPVVSTLAVAAVATTLLWWAGSIDARLLAVDPLAFPAQPWRLLTSTLPHVDVMHLAFNVYWLWRFGTTVEGTLGHARTAGLLALFGIGSSAAEYALLEGGVGLSGIGYGLAGLLFVLQRRDLRFRDAIDDGTTRLFVLWFFLCIALTAAKVWQVANIAHGVGAALGALAGLALAGRPPARRVAAAAAGALLVAALLGATAARPWVNLSGAQGRVDAYRGFQALERGEDEEAARLLARALVADPGEAGVWFNLGIARERLGDGAGAIDAYREAARRSPADADMRAALEEALLRGSGASRAPPEEGPAGAKAAEDRPAREAVR